MKNQKVHMPLSERLKSIPGIFGVHLAERPKYKVLKVDGDFELREYEPMLVAKTTVRGAYDQAKEQAYVRLANYIYGENRDKRVMAMTSPVLMDFKSTKGELNLTMSFILPSGITAHNVPKPNSAEVHLQKVPEQTFAVISFSGRNTLLAIDEKSQELQSWVMANGYRVDSSTLQAAQYDGPSTIPVFRRNEVFLRLWSDKIH